MYIPPETTGLTMPPLSGEVFSAPLASDISSKGCSGGAGFRTGYFGVTVIHTSLSTRYSWHPESLRILDASGSRTGNTTEFECIWKTISHPEYPLKLRKDGCPKPRHLSNDRPNLAVSTLRLGISHEAKAGQHPWVIFSGLLVLLHLSAE